MRLLLVNPRFPESFWSFRWALREVLGAKRAINPPLGLATLAALCPPEWQVTIVDENIEPVPLAPEVDVVGVCGMAVQYPRQRELLEHYRRQGLFVVAGGSYASLCPERYTELADSVVSGEAEYLWPAFCRDYSSGKPRPLYREQGVVDLAHSPTPRFDLLKLERYVNVSMQFSRGCPYRCEFCDIIVMFGRRPRTKSPDQIGRELDLLRARGVRSVFFVDDNLIGHKAKAKALLRFLADYQRRHRYRFQFGTEASLNVAEDEELLALLGEAGFGWLFIGIESPDEASLQETGKTQNTRQDILCAVRRIYAEGIDVLGGFIVGFDNDGLETFELQRRFIVASGIQVAMVGLLTALPKTPLHARLAREGRLLPEREPGDNTRAATNLVPKRMSYQDMVEGYCTLYRRLLSDRCVAERIVNKMRYLRRPLARGGGDRRERLRVLARFLGRGLLPGGPSRWRWFLHTLARSRPVGWPQVVSDWVAALALRSYAERYLRVPAPERDRLQADTAFHRLRSICAAARRRGALALSLERDGGGAPRIAITLRGRLERRVLARAARTLERLLADTTVTLSVHVDSAATDQLVPLARFLRRLAAHGERVSLRLSAELGRRLPIDGSAFHLALEER